MPLADDPLRQLRVSTLSRIGGAQWAEQMADRADIVETLDSIALRAFFGGPEPQWCPPAPPAPKYAPAFTLIPFDFARW